MQIIFSLIWFSEKRGGQRLMIFLLFKITCYFVLVSMFIIQFKYSIYFFDSIKGKEMTQSNLATATFGGGCFWCMVQPFENENTPGVTHVMSGYAGGTGENPTYQDYAQKGYIEVVQVTYDPEKVKYETLLDIFWHQIDPTDTQGQFYDRGAAYRPVIFYHSPAQKQEAEKSKQKLEKSGKFNAKIAVEILPFSTFYPAEQYHQDYYKKNPDQYKSYRKGSGRDAFLQKVWKDDTQLHKKLTPLQYQVTQCDATEPPFNNEYWDNKEPGIYVDRVSGEPLFSSLDKYDSGTGWPSFIKPLEPSNIIQKEDTSLAMPRTEIRSKKANAHLGHVFDDGPQPRGLRYCMNSAALRFIPVKDLEKEGYGKYLALFKDDNKR